MNAVGRIKLEKPHLEAFEDRIDGEFCQPANRLAAAETDVDLLGGQFKRPQLLPEVNGSTLLNDPQPCRANRIAIIPAGRGLMRIVADVSSDEAGRGMSFGLCPAAAILPRTNARLAELSTWRWI